MNRCNKMHSFTDVYVNGVILLLLRCDARFKETYTQHKQQNKIQRSGGKMLWL